MITLHQFQAVGDLRCQSKNRGVSGFSGFPCRDASLRNEGCFFLVPAGRSLLRSTTVPERNRGRSPCITARVFLVFVGIEYMLFVNSCRILCILCGLVGENYSRGSRMVLSPPLLAECSNMLIINTLSQNPAIHAIDYPTGKRERRHKTHALCRR